MHVLIKHWLKRWIPPAVADALRSGAGNPSKRIQVNYRAGGALLDGKHEFFLRDVHADQQVFRQVFLDEEYQIQGFAQRRNVEEALSVNPCPLIIDAGANIGASAVWFALTYPSATIIAVEPDRRNFEQLVKNSKSFPRIRPVHAAVGSKRGKLFLHDVGEGEWGFRTSDSKGAGSVEVDCMTIEDLVALAAGVEPFVLKIDIEGAEADLFESPPLLLARFSAVLIELHDWMLPGQASSRSFLRWHVGEGRDLVFRGENAFSFAIGSHGLTKSTDNAVN